MHHLLYRQVNCFVVYLYDTFLFYSLYRWVKFEEDVEEGGERWSKPHVATLSLHSLFELRCNILQGTVILDMEADTLPAILGVYIGHVG